MPSESKLASQHNQIQHQQILQGVGAKQSKKVMPDMMASGGIREFNENAMIAAAAPVIFDFHPQHSGDVEVEAEGSQLPGDKQEEIQLKIDDGSESQLKDKQYQALNIDEAGALEGQEQQAEEEEEEEEYSSEIEITEVFDPLLEDKQYLVTMIVTHFQEMGRPIATTHEFYRIGNKLGEGAFGKVCIAQHKLSGHFVAIKCLRKKDLNKQIECKKKVAQDMQILQHLTHHRNVVKLYDSFETKSHLCFVMELCAGGDLLSFVRRRKKLDETQAKFLFKQVAKGLAYCHRLHVLHRDIKLENLLLDEEGIVKICDFGVSQLLQKSTDMVQDQCGTPAYMAPEVFTCDKEFSGQQADVWSLGICLYAMLCGMVPFKGRSIQELRDCIIEEPLRYLKEIKKKLSREVRHLIKRMLIKDPKKRATMPEVLRHPWLRDCPKRLSVFSAPELKKIRVLQQPANGSDEPQRLLTEVEMTQQSMSDKEAQRLKKGYQSQYSLDYGQKVKNVSDRSFVLAPFNSTITQESFNQKMFEDAPIVSEKIIKFNDRVREANRQYEFNYNGEVDNGIMISLNADTKSPKSDNKPNSKRDKEESKVGKVQNHESAQQEPEALHHSKSEQQPIKSADVSVSGGLGGLINNGPQVSNASPQISESSSQKIVRIGQQAKQKGMSGVPVTTQAPPISQASLATEEEDKRNDTEAGVNQEEPEVQPVINFNGLCEVGYMAPPPVSTNMKPVTDDKDDNQPNLEESKVKPSSGQSTKQQQVDASADNTEDESIGQEIDDVNEFNLKVEGQGQSHEPSDDEEQIDNLIVCKIENEFGYPEQYLLDCLKNDRKNDATTCYYLFCKEDKHEIVNLLTDSPLMAAVAQGINNGASAQQRNNGKQ